MRGGGDYIIFRRAFKGPSTGNLQDLQRQAASQGSNCDFGVSLCSSRWAKTFTHKLVT